MGEILNVKPKSQLFPIPMVMGVKVRQVQCCLISIIKILMQQLL